MSDIRTINVIKQCKWGELKLKKLEIKQMIHQILVSPNRPVTVKDI